MNSGKEESRYKYPELFMETLGYCYIYLNLPFRQTEGLLRSHLRDKAKPRHALQYGNE